MKTKTFIKLVVVLIIITLVMLLCSSTKKETIKFEHIYSNPLTHPNYDYQIITEINYSCGSETFDSVSYEIMLNKVSTILNRICNHSEVISNETINGKFYPLPPVLGYMDGGTYLGWEIESVEIVSVKKYCNNDKDSITER